jgi:hypothetical protein
MGAFHLAIIGGGPSCTYVLERLAATAPESRTSTPLEIDVFEKTGEFGSGAVHSPKQPSSSILNRIAGQVAFAADESVDGAGPLLPRELRPTLHEWCRRRFRATRDPAFDLEAEDWPQRRVHGLALQDAFRTYAAMLAAQSIPVHLHCAEVTDVQERRDGFTITLKGGDSPVIRYDHVLFLTGHSSNRPRPSAVYNASVAALARAGNAVYVPSAYPLEQMIPSSAVRPGKVVGVAGMGLTAIDVILYLTEGRGGTFAADTHASRFVYHPSGDEPAAIVPFGTTGMFTFARPFNAKEANIAKLEHKPRFLTLEAIDALRESVGRPAAVEPLGIQKQLDYELHVHPLVLLEMALVYYTTLLGDEFGEIFERAARAEYRAFLEGRAEGATAARVAESLLAPAEECVTQAFGEIARALAGRNPAEERVEPAWSLETALERYVDVVFGRESSSHAFSPHRHSTHVEGNRFSWQRMIDPIPAVECSSPDRYRAALVDFMDRDHLWATQNNLDNPAKAAADGVWRDLRYVLAYAIDFGGLTASSHRKFLAVYMHHHNRLANGASLEAMKKVRALIGCGLVDPSVGPWPAVDVDSASERFVVRGRSTGAERYLDTIIDAKVHPFDPESDRSPLYRNMLRRGMVRKWRNPAADGSHFEPGGLALDANFHPIRAHGRPEHRFTVLGPPSEGVMFFQLGALRPNSNHHVIRDTIRWVDDFWDQVATLRTAPATAPMPAARVSTRVSELSGSRMHG